MKMILIWKVVEYLLKRRNIIVIDECSMISESILQDLKEEIDKCVENLIIPKIIFVGDPAQLSPVNESTSLVFNKDYFKSKYCCLLCDVVRNSNNNVMNMCNNVRKWVMGELDKPDIGKFVCDSVKFYRKLPNLAKSETRWFKKFMSKKYFDNSIIITWTNGATNNYNNEVRKRTYTEIEDLKRFEVGDKLMFNDFYKMPEISLVKDGFKFYTSEQVKIINREVITKKFNPLEHKDICKKNRLSEHTTLEAKYIKCIEEINTGTIRSYKLWKLNVCRILDANDVQDNKSYTIFVVHEDDAKTLQIEKNYSQFQIKTLWAYYKKSHSKDINNIATYIIKPIWKQWANVFIDSFASVEYGNSITTHKGQGSTYCNVFGDVDDILNNKNDDESKRCIYTAFTRPSKEIHILMPEKSA
jgi:ATP-dependent exoDNAse (exonuclease V) alpha subunit